MLPAQKKQQKRRCKWFNTLHPFVDGCLDSDLLLFCLLHFVLFVIVIIVEVHFSFFIFQRLKLPFLCIRIFKAFLFGGHRLLFNGKKIELFNILQWSEIMIMWEKSDRNGESKIDLFLFFWNLLFDSPVVTHIKNNIEKKNTVESRLTFFLLSKRKRTKTKFSFN